MVATISTLIRRGAALELPAAVAVTQIFGSNGALIDTTQPTAVTLPDNTQFGVTTGAAANDVLFIGDVTGFNSIQVEVQSLGGTSFRCEGSIDGVNRWADCPGYADDQLTTPNYSALLTSTLKYRFPVGARFMRIRQLGTGSTQIAVTGSQLWREPAKASTFFWTESTALLSGAGVFSGTARNNGGSASTFGTRYKSFVGEFFSDQAGTAFVEKSVDGTTFRTVATAALLANTSLALTALVQAQYYRVRLVNGAVTQTVALITSAYQV